MGNGTFVHTTEEKAILFAQFSKSMELAREGQRPFEDVSRPLQAIISDDMVVQITPKVVQSADGGRVFHVIGDFESAESALVAGGYKYRYDYAAAKANKIVEVPMIIQPVDRKVRLVPLGQIRTTRELFGLYPKIADPMTLLTLGARFPKEQLEGPIFVVWKDHSRRFWYAILSRDGFDRYVDVIQYYPDYEWGGNYRVLLCE